MVPPYQDHNGRRYYDLSGDLKFGRRADRDRNARRRERERRVEIERRNRLDTGYQGSQGPRPYTGGNTIINININPDTRHEPSHSGAQDIPAYQPPDDEEIAADKALAKRLQETYGAKSGTPRQEHTNTEASNTNTDTSNSPRYAAEIVRPSTESAAGRPLVKIDNKEVPDRTIPS